MGRSNGPAPRRDVGPGLSEPGQGALRAKVKVPPQMEGERLDKALAALVDDMSRGLARRVIAMGAVYIGKKRVRAASRPVRPGDVLTATWHPKVPAGPTYAVHEVYADEDLLVVNKPAGQLVAGTELGDVGSLQHTLEKQYGATTRLMHRLDKPASGLLVAARNKGASNALTPQFREHTIERRYLAVAAGPVPTGRVELPLRRQGRRMRIADPAELGEPGVMTALTDLVALEAGEGWTLLRATLFTGRTHQIRLHVASSGSALFGDRAYGGPGAPRLALHAAVLGFTGPDGVQRRFEMPPGDDFWAAAGIEPRSVDLGDEPPAS